MTDGQERKAHSPINIFLWLMVIAIIAGGVWANYRYQMFDVSYRVIGWIVVAVLAGGIAFLTSQGKRAFGFAKSARGELRKVVWPTRQETVRMTMIVIALVIVLSLIIWGLDSFLLWAVGSLTGQRG